MTLNPLGRVRSPSRRDPLGGRRSSIRAETQRRSLSTRPAALSATIAASSKGWTPLRSMI